MVDGEVNFGALVLFTRQVRVADDPWLPQQEQDHQTASLLPDAEMLNRLLRYETHAEKSLQRSLGMMARLRGETFMSMTAMITGPNRLE